MIIPIYRVVVDVKLVPSGINLKGSLCLIATQRGSDMLKIKPLSSTMSHLVKATDVERVQNLFLENGLVYDVSAPSERYERTFKADEAPPSGYEAGLGEGIGLDAERDINEGPLQADLRRMGQELRSAYAAPILAALCQAHSRSYDGQDIPSGPLIATALQIAADAARKDLATRELLWM